MIGFTITFDIDNDSFQGAEQTERETARVLRDIADKVEAGIVFGKVLDINGNSIGSWEFID